MKKRHHLKIFTFLTTIILLMLSTHVISKSQPESQLIKQVINRYEVALNASDTESVMKLYGEKPIFMPQHSAAQVGRTAVKKAYESVFTAIDLNIKFTIYEVEIHDNKAWARTSSAGKTIILANGVKINEGNNELFIFKKERGKWKIHRYLFSTTTPRQ
ncbi:hypothetical protein MNBD_GAMMA25-878 [hydrothermal vent metagenome]|uniref:DUF4440 domain-containing protein n=1 Tax=hydrothermal vent metagenome TaxID=652676 RepID=A0A3B1ARQ8_9ZZZZ